MSAMQPPLYQYDTNNAPVTRPRTLNDYRIGRHAAAPQQRRSSVLSTGLIIAVVAVAAGSFMVVDPLHLMSPRNATHAPAQSTPASTTPSVTPPPSFVPVDSPSPTAASLATPATPASPFTVTSDASVGPTPMASERRVIEPVAATSRASQSRQVANKSQAPTAKGGTTAAATRSQTSSTTDTSPSSSVVERPSSPTEIPKVIEASAVKDDSN